MSWLLGILKLFLGFAFKQAQVDATTKYAELDPKLKGMVDELNNLPPTPPC